MRTAGRLMVGIGIAAAWSCCSDVPAAHAYTPIVPTLQDRTVVLTGRSLTIDEVVAVARHGAQVAFSAKAIQHAVDGRGLMLEADAEGITVYGVNRGGGALREVSSRQETEAGRQPRSANADGAPPEIDDEALVRANMVIRANTIPANASTPEFMQALVLLLNRRVTPVMYSRGSLGEGDLFVNDAVDLTLAGRRDAYYRGVRMPALEALRRAGITPPHVGLVETGGTNNAYAIAQAAFMVADGRDALAWADLILAMDLDAMDSSLTPLAMPVQAARPFAWVNWDAERVLDMLRGGYLFQADARRILQDPESLRASYVRQGSAWQAWAALRDAVTLQMNSSSANPIPAVGASPSDSWELSTPQMMKYYVKGGPLSHGQHGFIFSGANWDPFPMANAMETLSNALANMDAAVAQRIERFSDRTPTPFFTGIKPADVLTPEQRRLSPSMSEPYFLFLDIWGEIQVLGQSVPAQSNAADVGVADIAAETRLKGEHGRRLIDLSMQLLGYDLVDAAYWLDVRRMQDPSRRFGAGPTAAWEAFRRQQPWQQEPADREDLPFGIVADRFMRAHPAATFTPAGPPMPTTGPT